MKLTKEALRFAAVYIMLMLVFTGLLTASYLIPTQRIQQNAADAIELLSAEGVYPRPFFNDASTQGDNFTEALVLSMAGVSRQNGLFYDAMNNAVDFNGEYPIESLNALLPQEGAPQIATDYYGLPRYWNGAMSFIKPLMAVFSYKSARAFCFQLIMVLFAAVVISLRKHLGSMYALGFAAALTAISFFALPSSISMVMPWVFTFAACLAVLQKKTFKYADCFLLFFAVGCCINYVDYMLTVLYGLGIPLVILLSLYARQQKGLCQSLGMLIGCSAFYFIGFALSWAFKWAAASVALGKNIFSQALTFILWRSESLEGTSRFDAITANYTVLLTPFFKAAAAVILAVLILCVIFFYKKGASAPQNAAAVLLTAFYPCIWYLFAANHAIIHHPFVYHYTVITVLAVLFALLNLINQASLKSFLLRLLPHKSK